MDKWSEVLGFDWKLLLPLLAVQIILIIVALVDLIRNEKERIRGPKWLWAIIIIVGEILGPVVYFVLGRRND